jgi:hypothetical protein
MPGTHFCRCRLCCRAVNIEDCHLGAFGRKAAGRRQPDTPLARGTGNRRCLPFEQHRFVPSLFLSLDKNLLEAAPLTNAQLSRMDESGSTI